MTDGVTYHPSLSKRFRGYYPVVIDIETGGVNAETDAVLEIAAITLNCDDDGQFSIADQWHNHVEVFEGGILNPESLAIHGIDPYHPFRFAMPEKKALESLFSFVRGPQQQTGCSRCVLVGHNAWFDLAFLNAAIARTKIKRNPFHRFTCFDTATLSALWYGQTVLAQGLKKAGISFDPEAHHSALYDATQTAKLFCTILNQHQQLTEHSIMG